MKLKTLDMQFIRYLNLFEKITRVRTKNCFSYNNHLLFAVPSELVSKAIGAGGENVKKLSNLIGKRVKIISIPSGTGQAERFIEKIVAPTQFKSLEITPDAIVISGSRQSKASLIGRNKVRLEELKQIVREFFGKDLKII